MINWQFFPDSAPAVCEAYGNLPTVAIDTPEPPCQKTFVGADNHLAGLVAGKGLGDFAKAKFDCAYDAYVSLDFPTIPDINGPRAGGSREGFEGVCGPIPDGKYFSIDTLSGGPDQPENTRRLFTDLLTTLPDAKTILVIGPAGDTMPHGGPRRGRRAGPQGPGLDRWPRGRPERPRRHPQRAPVGAATWPTSPSATASSSCPWPSPWRAARPSRSRSPRSTHEFITRDNIDQYYPAPMRAAA